MAFQLYTSIYNTQKIFFIIHLKIITMNTVSTLHSNNRQRIATMLIYLLICLVYAVVLMYAAYIIFAFAEKLQTYFNSWTVAANDQLNYCIR
jgi:hypothetical protein